MSLILGGALALAGGLLSAKGAEDAAEAQADAITNAQAISSEAAKKARLDVLSIMVPALSGYTSSLQAIEGTIKQGTVDIMDIFTNSTQQASNILANSGINAKQAILGSQAVSQGTPYQQFSADYAKQNIQELPTMTLDKALATGALPTGVTDLLQREVADISAPERTIGAGPTGTTPTDIYSLQAAVNAGLVEPGQQLDFGVGPVVSAPEAQPATVGAGGLSPIGTVATPSAAATSGISGPTVPLTMDKTISPDISGPTVPLTPSPTVAPTTTAQGPGYYDAVSRLESGYQTGLGQLIQGTTGARSDIAAGRDASLGAIASTRSDITGRYDPYTQVGTQALYQEAALSGALGPEAQQAAMDAYIESPGQKYLREQQEQALLRNAAAVGGLGGGNVLTALQEQAMGIASTQQQQYLENLRSLGAQGLTATGDLSGMLTGLTGLETGVQTQAAQDLANLSANLGINAAQLTQMSSSELAQLSSQTGIALANLESAQGAAQSALASQYGTNLANLSAASLGDIAGLQQQAAYGLYQGQTDIAQILANLGVGAGTQLAGLEANKGSAIASGIYGQSQAWTDTLSGLGKLAMYNYGVSPNTTTTG